MYKDIVHSHAQTHMPRKSTKAPARKAPAAKRAQRAPRAARPAAAKARNATVNAIAKSVGSMIGNAILPGVGGVLGGGIADLGHAAIHSITGMGDYQVQNNSLLMKGDAVPQFNVNQRSTRVRHREYIADVTSSASPGAFSVTPYSINPAIQATFPWLASVAANYEEYRIHGMIFEFKTMSADALNSTNTALGNVIMATQYNVLAPDFVNKQQMENYEFGCSTKPSNSLMHAIECQPAETPVKNLFTRISNVSGSDLRLYDFGKFYIATNGLQAASVNLGELWVSYDIELYKPRLTNGRTLMDHVKSDGTGVSGAAYFGSSPVATTYSNFGCTFGTNTITIPATYSGNLAVYYVETGTGAATGVGPQITGSGGLTPLNVFINNSTNLIRISGSTTGMNSVATFSCVGGGTILFASATFNTVVSSVDCMVMSIPQPMN